MGMPLATILVADDSDATRELLTELLRGQGYRVIGAKDGAEAAEAFASQPIDLALLDVMMPRRSGFAVCRAVKARPETRLTPVVLVTGLASTDDRIKGIESGADDFLNKPVRKEELLARVRSLLRLKRFTDELENAEAVLCSLARSIEAKDPYTEGHCDRLSRYSVALAESLRQPNEQCVALRRGRARHRQGGRARAHPAEARPARSRGAPDHGNAPGRGRAHLQPPEIISPGSTDHPPPPRASGRQRIPGWAGPRRDPA